MSRWDVGPAQYFGARLGTPAERAEGKAIIWDTEAVIPLTASFVARFPRELSKALRHGDLKEVKAPEKAAKEQADKDAEEAKAAAAQAAPEALTQTPNTPPADGKAEKRK